ncbi:MAG: HEAT repeat domain-containing protein [Candidatus Handelsmanbacteria bacterium]|nr:HEAT repeat domain-containing protein [Candidatus Handelsmanbacteria bacterium]
MRSSAPTFRPPSWLSRLQQFCPVLLGLWLSLATTGCAVRTLPPIKYVPLLGKEKEIPTTQVLVKALGDRDLNLRAQAVQVLGVLGQSKSNKLKREVAEALGMALKDHDPGIRLQAVELLGKMEDKYANRYLLSALKDTNPFIRDQVLKMLSVREGTRIQAEQQALAEALARAQAQAAQAQAEAQGQTP